MLKEAFAAIQETLTNAFPRVKVLLNWPEPRQRISYPHLVILNVKQDQIHYPEQFLEQITNADSSKTNVYQLGEWRCRVDLNYFAKSAVDLVDFVEKMTNFFQTSPQKSLAKRSLNIPFGSRRPYEILNFTLQDYLLNQQAYPLQAGSGRSSVFQCTADFPDLVRNNIPIMTDVRLDEEKSEVSENPSISGAT